MNYFFAPPEDWHASQMVEIKGQEATHLVKVLRHKIGDSIQIADGMGKIYNSTIVDINRQTVRAQWTDHRLSEAPNVKKVLALGIIKKRDRLEFAIEKAVELGATELCLFHADYSERTKLNEDRLKLLIISAFKQSGRYWLPELVVLASLDAVYRQYSTYDYILAHEVTQTTERAGKLTKDENVLLIGPEGGFSPREIQLHEEVKGQLISLGKNRLRAETAVTAILSQYLFTEQD